MGGSNSGRRGGKRVTGDMHALDVRDLSRAGRLTPGQSFGWSWSRRGSEVASINIQTGEDQVTLRYRNRSKGGDWQDMRYAVQLAWTACHYGGQRAWWLCPGVGCGRRVAVLYGGKVYACRHCQRLAYPSQRETPGDRAIRRVNALRKQLGWVPGLVHGDGDKPKGMHWRTYDRVRMSYYAHSYQAFAGMAEEMGLAMGRLGRIGTLRF